MRLEVPPPSRVVYERELARLEEEVGSFVGMVREDLPLWEATELRFGFDDSALGPLELPLPSGGMLRLRGAIDRVDVLPSGGLRVVDYKTGAFGRFSAVTVWNGGRRLQHLVYTEAAERLLGRSVDRMEYQFPTRKGQNERSRFPRADLKDGPALLDRLLDVVADGRFLPTENADDCRFCEFAAVCRVQEGDWGKTASARAAWAKAHFESEAYGSFQLVRLFRDRGKRK
jgi:ATP-dependent helicase/nuclease subunit B